MSTCSLLLVGADPRFVALASEAARVAFSGAPAIQLATLAEALARPLPPGPAVLALFEPADDDALRATQARRPDGLPRWAVVIFAEKSPLPEAEIIPSQDRNSALIARVLRSSATLHRLKLENEMLRGDLFTLGRRIAHDLRTPLGCTSIALEGLRDALAEDSPAALALLQPIAASTDELAGIIQRVSLLARATAAPPPLLELDMAPVVWAALERLQPQIHETGAEIAEPPSWPTVLGDLALLEAVWLELISNSLRHGGPVPKIELGWDRSGQGHRFWIRDQGPGVDEHRRAALFQSFHLLHEPSAARGLGLPIVQRLVGLQGGGCGYEPAPKQGARFYFTLPA